MTRPLWKCLLLKLHVCNEAPTQPFSQSPTPCGDNGFQDPRHSLIEYQSGILPTCRPDPLICAWVLGAPGCRLNSCKPRLSDATLHHLSYPMICTDCNLSAVLHQAGPVASLRRPTCGASAPAVGPSDGAANLGSAGCCIARQSLYEMLDVV